MELNAGALSPMPTPSQVGLHQETKSDPVPGLLTPQRPLVPTTASTSTMRSGCLPSTFTEGQLYIISAKSMSVCFPRPSQKDSY